MWLLKPEVSRFSMFPSLSYFFLSLSSSREPLNKDQVCPLRGAHLRATILLAPHRGRLGPHGHLLHLPELSYLAAHRRSSGWPSYVLRRYLTSRSLSWWRGRRTRPASCTADDPTNETLEAEIAFPEEDLNTHADMVLCKSWEAPIHPACLCGHWPGRYAGLEK